MINWTHSNIEPMFGISYAEKDYEEPYGAN